MYIYTFILFVCLTLFISYYLLTINVIIFVFYHTTWQKYIKNTQSPNMLTCLSYLTCFTLIRGKFLKE
jgi:hypothetical protein